MLDVVYVVAVNPTNCPSSSTFCGVGMVLMHHIFQVKVMYLPVRLDVLNNLFGF